MVKKSFANYSNFKIEKENKEIFDAQAIIRQIFLNHPIIHRLLRLMHYNQRNRYINHCITKLFNFEKRFPECSKRILIGNIIPPTSDYYWKNALSAMR